jgi:hypothetical protein
MLPLQQQSGDIGRFSKCPGSRDCQKWLTFVGSVAVPQTITLARKYE